MKKLRNKLKSKAGESIAETLLALLIASFALMTLAGMINVTTRIVNESKQKMDGYYTKNAALETLDGGNSMTVEIKLVDPADTPMQQDVVVVYDENTVFSGHPVIAYRLSED